MTTDNRTNEKIETRKCSNQACPLRRAHSGPCAPSDWKPGAPSEAQVEAALAAHEAHKGAWVDEFREMVCPECGWCYMTEHERRSGNKPSNEVVYARVDAHRMRAALVAAAGAAPQAPSSERANLIGRLTGSANPLSVTCGECGSKPGKRCYGNGEMRRPHPSRETKAERELMIEAAEALAAPVLPSSTVDEAALIREAKAEALEEFAGQMATGFNQQTLNAERRAIKREARARAAEYREGSET